MIGVLSAIAIYFVGGPFWPIFLAIVAFVITVLGALAAYETWKEKGFPLLDPEGGMF